MSGATSTATLPLLAEGSDTPTDPSVELALPAELKEETAIAVTIVVKAVAGLRRTIW